MRVAIVSPYSWSNPGGVNNHVEGLGARLIASGHEVTIVAPGSGPHPAGSSFVSAGASVPVPANGSIARLALYPAAYHRVKSTLARGFDVVHVHEPMVPLVSIAAVRCAPCALVGTFHAAAGNSRAYSLLRAPLRRVHSSLHGLIAVSEAAKELASRYFPGDYEVIPNGVDLSRFSPSDSRPEGFPADGPVILFVGRGEKRKGLDLLIEAFPSVAARIPGCRLVVVGEGHERKGALPFATFAGCVRNEELPAYYSSADVFCAPALGGESFGIVLAESMASGTPVVASDIPGYRAVVEATGGGLLFERGESASLADSLVTLLRDAGMRRRLAAAGLEGVRSFSWETLAAHVEDVYRRAVARWAA